MFNYGWIDVHCHLTDERIFSNLNQEISSAAKAGLTGFVSSALCKEEYEIINIQKFQELQKTIKWCAGIHPYYHKSSENDFELLIKLCDNKDIIAITSSKKQMDRFQLFKMVKSIYKSAGIKQTGLHILRHTFAKGLIENKISLPTVQKLLGHNDIKTTMIYVNPHQDIILNELKISKLN